MNYGVVIGPWLAIATHSEESGTQIWSSENGHVEIPAIVQMREEDLLVGTAAERERMMYPDRTADLPVDISKADELLSAGDVSVIPLRGWELLFDELVTDSYQDVDTSVTLLVIPDRLSRSERSAFIESFGRKVSDQVRTVDKSIVACHAVDQVPSEGEGILVCHASPIGFGCSVVAHGPTGVKVTDSFYDKTLGTKIIDDYIYETVREEMINEGYPDPDDDAALQFDVYDSVREMKKALSNTDRADAGVNVGGDMFTYQTTRKELLSKAKDHTSSILSSIEGLLKSPVVERAPVTVLQDAILVVPEGDAVPFQHVIDEQTGGTTTVVRPRDLAPAAAQLPTGIQASGETAGSPSVERDEGSSSSESQPSGSETTSERFEVRSISGLSFEDSEGGTEAYSPDAGDPFEVLGVARTTPLHEIKNHAQNLLHEIDDTEAIGEIADALEEISEGPHIKKVGNTTIEPLILQTDETEIEVGEPLEISVYNMNDDPIEGAEVSIDGQRRGVTDERGTVEVRANQVGTHSIKARRKHPADGYEFRAVDTHVNVTKREKALSFASTPQAVEAGEVFDIVVLADEEPVSDATVQAPRGSFLTDQHGTAQMSLSSPGEATLVANKDSTGSRNYVPATTTVTVQPRQVSLRLKDVPDTVPAGSTVDVRVTDDNGDGVASAEVALGDTTILADDEGYATVQVLETAAPQVEIEASKPDTPGITYEGTDRKIAVDDSGTHNVEADTQTLSISCVDGQPVVGEPVTFEVTDGNGTPIESVYVSGTDGSSDLTGADGLAEIAFNEVGMKTVSASASGGSQYENHQSDSCKVEVGKKARSLKLGDLPSELPMNETAEVTVTSAEGEPVESATLKVDDKKQLQTGSDGQVSVSFDEPGERTLRASKPESDTVKYEPATRNVVVMNELEFDSCPAQVVKNERFQFRIVDGDGDPVPGAVVRGPDQHSDPTGEDGVGELVLHDDGLVHLKVEVPEHPRYGESVETVRVRDSDNET